MSSEPINQNSIGLLVVDQISAMLAYWDRNLVCRFANSAYRDWFGKTKEEMIDKMTIRELLGELYVLNEPYILGALKGIPQTFEREIKTPSGELRYSLANYYPNIINGEVLGFYVHVADITSTKLLEIELTKSNKVIKEQNERLLSFANIVSHNLKSYANNLKSILDLFLKANSPAEKDIMLNFLKGISNGFTTTINHLSQIVDIQNQSGLNLQHIKLYDLIKHSMEILNFEIEESQAVILNNVPQEVIILANPAYTESIILNLLTNAIKYRHPLRHPEIKLMAMVRNNGLEFRVADNGLGINLKKYKNDIFGMYKTFHGNSDAKGIGLYITKLQVEGMGGKIEIESEENVGSTFIITFNQ